MLTATFLICLLSSGRSQIMCNSSLIFTLNRELPLRTKCQIDPVVYKFTCANCNVSYVGETYRHFNVRIKEHLTSHSSNIFLHLKRNEICKSSCDESCFKVIDSDNSRFRLKSNDQSTYSNRRGSSEARWWNAECVNTYKVSTLVYHRLHTK